MPLDPKDFLDWSKTPMLEPSAKDHVPLKQVGSGEEVLSKQFADMMFSKGILKHPAQPTDQQMFGHLVVTPEELKKKEDNWNNFFKNYFTDLVGPVEKQQSPSWGRGPIEKETLSEEEKRIQAIPVDPSLLTDE